MAPHLIFLENQGLAPSKARVDLITDFGEIFTHHELSSFAKIDLRKGHYLWQV